MLERVNRPALVIAPNKILAAQLYGEFKSLFPENAVEYFVSYYDYYQPEAYVPTTDTYIEKESSINDEIDKMRHSATRSLLTRRDVVIVASVSCIYGIGSPESYGAMRIEIEPGATHPRDQFVLLQLESIAADHQHERFSRRSRITRQETARVQLRADRDLPAGRILRQFVHRDRKGVAGAKVPVHGHIQPHRSIRPGNQRDLTPRQQRVSIRIATVHLNRSPDRLTAGDPPDVQFHPGPLTGADHTPNPKLFDGHFNRALSLHRPGLLRVGLLRGRLRDQQKKQRHARHREQQRITQERTQFRRGMTHRAAVYAFIDRRSPPMSEIWSPHRSSFCS